METRNVSSLNTMSRSSSLRRRDSISVQMSLASSCQAPPPPWTLVTIDAALLEWLQALVAQLMDLGRHCLALARHVCLPPPAVERVSCAVLIAVHVYTMLVDSLTEHQWLESITLSPHVLWMLPLATTVMSASLSVTLLLQWHPMDGIVLAGLVALLVVECLVAVAVVVAGALLVLGHVPWETAVGVIAVVWITSTVSSRCIRVALYPTLGHG